MTMSASETQRRAPLRPWAGVVVVVWRDDRFLLTLRAKPPRAGIWGLPGGALQLGETALAAAVREVREETGIVCQPQGSFTTVDVIEREADGTVQFHFLLAAVVARWQSGEIVAQDDAADARWFSVADLGTVANFPTTEELVRQSQRIAQD